MAANFVWIWIKIRRLDQQFESGSSEVPESLQQVLLPHVTEFEELKSMVYSWPGLTVDAQKVIKVRRHDGFLIPLSALYQGSTKEKPFILDVVNFYQSSLKRKENEKESEKKEASATEKDLKEAFEHKLDQLEKRIQAAEKRSEDSIESHEEDIAESAKKLSETIDFLSRRIDELTPSEWKDQLKPS